MKTASRWSGGAAAALLTLGSLAASAGVGARGPAECQGGIAADSRTIARPGTGTSWLDFGRPSQPPVGGVRPDSARVPPIPSAT
jgi:hypothetical protein